ncbi:hypothetical protein [Ruegeria sp. HKCCA4633]|uniref:hypothetical protein n=1 Tax=Ruegeria sp. HKCCA4633 TaxID=2682983 RepID=UPI0014887A0C|nr:hypothetical protein [Ruegeria sp. HKCCA4633]
MSGPAQPLIRLSSARPFLSTLNTACPDADELLTRLGISRSSCDEPEAHSHPIVTYHLFEEVEAATNDIDLPGKLGAFLTPFEIAATEHSGSTEHHLNIYGRPAVMSEKRCFETPFVPVQLVAFFACLFSEIAARVAGSSWSADNTLVNVSDPNALLDDFKGSKPILAQLTKLTCVDEGTKHNGIA